MAEKKFNYNEAIEEIEKILESFGDAEQDIETLSRRVKRATELIKQCRERLRKTEEDISQILNGEA